jgi:hypothetical protein
MFNFLVGTLNPFLPICSRYEVGEPLRGIGILHEDKDIDMLLFSGRRIGRYFRKQGVINLTLGHVNDLSKIANEYLGKTTSPLSDERLPHIDVSDTRFISMKDVCKMCSVILHQDVMAKGGYPDWLECSQRTVSKRKGVRGHNGDIQAFGDMMSLYLFLIDELTNEEREFLFRLLSHLDWIDNSRVMRANVTSKLPVPVYDSISPLTQALARLGSGHALLKVVNSLTSSLWDRKRKLKPG